MCIVEFSTRFMKRRLIKYADEEKFSNETNAIVFLMVTITRKIACVASTSAPYPSLFSKDFRRNIFLKSPCNCYIKSPDRGIFV